MTNIHQEEDDLSCATGFETIPASNIRRVTLSPKMSKRNNEGTGNKNGNQEHDEFLGTFVAELMWLVSVDNEDLVAAAKNRRKIFEYLIIMLSDKKKISHEMIYGLFGIMECEALNYLRSDFMAQFSKLLNAFDENTKSYAQRGNFVSLIRGLLAAADFHDLPSHISSAVADHDSPSDVTAHEGEDTTAAEIKDTAAPIVEGAGIVFRTVRSLGHGMSASGNLTELGGTEEQGAARMPSPIASLPDNTGFHLSASSSAKSGSTILNAFLHGDYVSLEQLNVDDLLRALSSDWSILVSLLIVPDGEAYSRAREGNTDDFSGNGGSDKKPAAK